MSHRLSEEVDSPRCVRFHFIHIRFRMPSLELMDVMLKRENKVMDGDILELLIPLSRAEVSGFARQRDL